MSDATEHKGESPVDRLDSGHDHHHGHDADDGEVHAHIGSYKGYLTIFMALICLTLLTVGVASIHLGAANLAVAVVIASMKAALVCAFFMHLKDDTKFHTIILIVAVLFIGVFFAYTTNDTGHRAQLDTQGGARALLVTGEKAPGSYDPPAVPDGGVREGEKH